MITFVPGMDKLQEIIKLAAIFSVFLAGMYFVAVRHKGLRPFTPLLPLTYMFLASITFILFYPLNEVGTDAWLDRTGMYMFRIMIITAAYYAALMLAHEGLRKWFRPSVSAVLWQVPGILYISGMLRRGRDLSGLFLFVLPPGILRICTRIWLAGFAAVVLYYVVQHIYIKRKLLADCKKPDERIYAVYKKAYDGCSAQGSYPLRVSKHTATPLTIGFLSHGSTYILLPEKDYTDSELELIFRHELVHLQRDDIAVKVHMTIFRAILWFLPFIWFTGKKVSADIELSCDQAVISGLSEEQKQEYAELILNTAGRDKGFTSCLSASAESLRYRVANLFDKKKKSNGIFLIAICLFFVLLPSFLIMPVAEAGYFRDTAYASMISKASVFEEMQYETNGETKRITINHPEAIAEEIGSLSIAVCGETVSPNFDGRIRLIFDLEDGRVLYIYIYKEMMTISLAYDGVKVYVFPESIDLDKLAVSLSG